MANENKNSPTTVTVCCKTPHGIILRTFHEVTRSEPVLGGGTRDFKTYQQDPETFTVKGNAVAIDKAPEHRIVGGYGLTHGVPAALWEKWLLQNKDSELVRNRLIFAETREDAAVDHAKEQRKTVSGLQPLDPVKDPRAPRGVSKATDKMETADL